MGVPSYHVVETQIELTAPRSRRRRCCLDWATTFTLLLVWGCLALISVILLGFTRTATSPASEAGSYVSSDEVVGIITLDSLPILLAAIFNEVLVDRSWRRIIYFALGRKARTLSNAQLAVNLRAANFDLWTFVCRLFRGRLSRREYRSAISYALLRWGTTVSIASAQLAISWKPAGDHYIADKRYIMLAAPVLLHACSIFGAITVWRWPWAYFSHRYDDAGLLRKYEPYLERIQGSLATFKEIAKALEEGTMVGPGRMEPVQARVRSGRQIRAKLKGLSFGLVAMFVPPALAWGFVKSKHVLTLGEYRFAFNLVFLAQNVLYTIALDFAIWNISLDGFCKTPKARPNKSLRHLGYSSGAMLLTKALRQRRPVRACLFLWAFWLQACLMRFLTVLYTFSVTVLSYYSIRDMADVLDPDFWLGWSIMTVGFTFPLFFIWILKKVDAPVCSVDGWRWAQLAQNALYEPGYYGIRNGRAVWAGDVELFSLAKGERLI